MLKIEEGKDVRITKNEAGYIGKVEVKESYSQELGELQSIFHYRLGKELEVSLKEDGTPTEAYCTIIINHTNPIDYEEFHKNVCIFEVARNGGLDIQYIHPISKEEYEAQMGV